MPLALPPPPIGLGTGSSDRIIRGTKTSVPVGVDALIEFNSLLMNDRDWYDTFVVTQIDGLGDADIRDDREVNPSDDGETPGDAFYGGKTLVMHGYIRAFDLWKLRDMEQALRYAFGDVSQEYPLIFHTPDIDTDHLIYCKKNAPMSIDEGQNNDQNFNRNFMITLRASNPRFLSFVSQLKYQGLGVIDSFASDSIGAGVYTFFTGSGTMAVAGGKLNPSSTALKALVRNDQINYSDIDVVLKYTPAGAFTSSAVSGIGRALDSSNYLYGGVDAAGQLFIKKHDVGSDSAALATGTTVSRSLGTTYWLRFRIDHNLITVTHYTTDPRDDTSGLQGTATYTLSGGEITKYGAGVVGEAGFRTAPGATSWTYDDLSVVPWGMDGIEVLTILNKGNFKARPKIELAGPMTNPVLTNITTGDILAFSGSIPKGSIWTYDLQEKTLVDEDGDNKFGMLALNSNKSFGFTPGDNHLALSATSMGPVSSAVVPSIQTLYKHTWR